MMACRLVAPNTSFLLLLVVAFGCLVQVASARQLRAVIPASSALKARAYDLRPTFDEHELAYVDTQPEAFLDHVSAPGGLDYHIDDQQQRPFGATVRFSSKQYPLLHLDRAVDHFSHVFCGAFCSISTSSLSTMEMHFHTKMQLLAAQEAWKDAYPFAMIISDSTCAYDDGSAHQHYLVYEVHFYVEELAATMVVQRTSFQTAADTVHVEFGKRQVNPSNVRPARLVKDKKSSKAASFRKGCGSRKAVDTRSSSSKISQTSTTSASAKFQPRIANTASSNTTTTTTINHKRSGLNLLPRQQNFSSSTATTTSFQQTFAYSTPTQSPTATVVVKDLTSRFTDVSLLPPDAHIRVQIPNVNVPVDVTLSCTECTTTGMLELVEGALTMKASDNRFESFEAFTHTGFVKVAARGVGASLGFRLVVSPTFAAKTFTAYLPTLAMPGLSIPGVGAIGPIFQPQIQMTLAVDSGLVFTSGFDIFVPDSQIMLNVTHPENSTTSGFDKSVVVPHELGVTAIPPALSFSLAFKPEILLGFEADDELVQGGAGIFLHLPEFNATLSKTHNVFENCTAAPPQAQNTSTDVVFSQAYQLAKSLVVDLGIEADLKMESMGISYSDTLVSKVRPLSTDCLVFDPKSHALLNATSPDFRTHASKSSSATSTTRLLHDGFASTAPLALFLVALCMQALLL